MKTIGILGGMGPEATAELYLDVVRIFQQEYNARYDADFPPFFIFSLPIPDVVESLEDEELLVSLLQYGVKKLEQSGADFIVIACNSVQVYLSQMQQAVKIPILSIPRLVAQEAANKNYQKVGLLATETTLKNKLFEKEMTNKEIFIPDEDEQREVTAAIMNILSGCKSNLDQERLKKIIAKMKLNGAEAVILGCTELPLLVPENDSSLPLLNTLKILARAAVKECRQNIYK